MSIRMRQTNMNSSKEDVSISCKENQQLKIHSDLICDISISENNTTKIACHLVA